MDVLVDPDHVEPGALVDLDLGRLRMTYQSTGGNLDELGSSVRAQQYDKVIVLGYRRGLTPPEADARSLLSLLILQQALVASSSGKRPRIVT